MSISPFEILIREHLRVFYRKILLNNIILPFKFQGTFKFKNIKALHHYSFSKSEYFHLLIAPI